jgi:hypothetical protein
MLHRTILRASGTIPFVFACPPSPPSPSPPAHRPRYALHVRVRPGLAIVDGTESVRFTANRPTKRIVFRLWANSPHYGSNLDVRSVRVDGVRVRGRMPSPTTMVLPHGVARNQTATIRLAWRLRVARSADRIGRWQTGLRLGSFFPILPWDAKRGWLIDPAARILGESSTSPTADFDVRVRAPAGYTAVVSGTPASPGRWHARAVRDVAVAVGRFRPAVGTVHVPNAVTVRVEAAPHTQVPRDILTVAANSLRALSRRYGAYPWKTYTLVVSPDLHDVGIEYPTLVFIGGSDFITTIVQHETAHQWFYSLVGNDQERDPWLDGALATWAQVHLRSGFPGAPVTGARPRHVGSPMSFFAGRQSDYFREVYGGGLQALTSLRAPRRVDCALRRYAAREAYAIAQPSNLLDELDRVIPGASSRLRRYGIRR